MQPRRKQLNKYGGNIIVMVMKKWIIYGVTALVLVAIGIAIGKSFQKENKVVVEKATAKKQMWTCSMHPSIFLDRPGKCPICHMALIKADVVVLPFGKSLPVGVPVTAGVVTDLRSPAEPLASPSS